MMSCFFQIHFKLIFILFFPAVSQDREIAVLQKMGITAEEVVANMLVRIITSLCIM